MDKEKSALMLNHSGAESVHAAMRKWSSQAKIGLVESCVQDAARAASQVGAFVNFNLHGRKGRGPSLFELRLRDASAVGNVESFFPKLNTVLTQPEMREYSSANPLDGDVETVQMKRGAVKAGRDVVVEDSHRPDIVLVTRPTKRKFRGLANRDPKLKSVDATVVDLSSDGSAESDVVIVETPRRATRSSQPTVDQNHTPERSSQPSNPEPVCRRVQETDVGPGMFFLARISTSGKSPGCRGAFRGKERGVCARFIREVGLKQTGLGVVGICWLGRSKFNSPEVPYPYWFCPNNQCCQKSSMPFVTGVLPHLPSKLPVARGTNISREEVVFLQENGINVHFDDDGFNEVVSATDIILDLNTFLERLDPTRPDERLTRRNGSCRRRRGAATKEGLARVRSAKTEAMVCTSVRRIVRGNGTGLRLIVNNTSRGRTSMHCVQICVFPTCSCKDFMYRESMARTYFPCKHLYWCFANICKRDIDIDQCVNQPILTLTEVRDLVLDANID